MSEDSRPTAMSQEVPSDGGDHYGALAPGVRIAKYEISTILGQGGFGITYRARDSRLDRDVAIKEYLPTAFARRHGSVTVVPRSTQTAERFLWGRTRFLDEAKTLARLGDAPGIVDVYDFLEENGTAYMVMALVRGDTLEARLARDRRLQPTAIEQLLYPLLDGLEIVHDAGFLHRDIKPANILLDAATGRPTLIDFGASRQALQGHSQAMTAIYTPGYAAFEQVTSGKQGPWTDIYGLAATLYHAVAGVTPPSALERLAEGRLIPASEVGKGRYAPGLLAAIDAGLRLKPAERPQGISEWRRVLAGMAPERAVEAPGTLTGKMDELPTRRAPDVIVDRRRPALPWIVAGVLALVLAAGGAWMMLRPPPETSADILRRVEEEARKQAALAARLRQEEEERQKAAAEAARKAEQEAARKTAEEEAAAEAAARRQDEEAGRQRAAAEAARRQAEEESARKAAEERAAAEAVARRKAEEVAAERAAAEAAQRRAEEQARAEAEAKRRGDQEAPERRAAEEKASAERSAAETARRRAEEQARAEAEAKRRGEQEALERRAAEEKAAAERAADETARRRAEEQARAEAEAKRRSEQEALERRAAAEKEAAELAARRKAEEKARLEAEAEAARRREEEERRVAEEKTRAEAAVRRQAEVEARAKADEDARRQAQADARKAAEDKARNDADAKRQGETAEAALRLGEQDRKRVQVALTALGHDTRGTDGAFGPRTRQMIATWQKNQGAPETGYLTAPQLASLRQQAAAALARYDEDQKKLDEEKRKADDAARRRQEEEATRRAEDERRKQSQPKVAAAPPVTSPPAAGAAGVDGRWSGTMRCDAHLDRESAFTLDISNGRGTSRRFNVELTVVLRNDRVHVAVSATSDRGYTMQGSLDGRVSGSAIDAAGSVRGLAGELTSPANCSLHLARH